MTRVKGLYITLAHSGWDWFFGGYQSNDSFSLALFFSFPPFYLCSGIWGMHEFFCVGIAFCFSFMKLSLCQVRNLKIHVISSTILKQTKIEGIWSKSLPYVLFDFSSTFLFGTLSFNIPSLPEKEKKKENTLKATAAMIMHFGPFWWLRRAIWMWQLLFPVYYCYLP